MTQYTFDNHSCRQEELNKAAVLTPEIKTWSVPAKSVVNLVPHPASWQHVGVSEAYPADLLKDQILSEGERIVLDFGETLVGKVRLKLESINSSSAPVRLKLLAAELPYEADADPETFCGGLGRGWLQEEMITIYDMPSEIELPNRYSLRYLVINVIACSVSCAVKLVKVEVIAQSTAGEKLVPPLPGWDQELTQIDAACSRTLRNCMQNILEDGPKRDRRLWLGDLRLQALVNHVTFRRYDQVERSIRLLSACRNGYGMIPGAVIMKPEPHASSFILDYSLIFSRLLLEHCRFSGNSNIGDELFEIAEHQLSFFREGLDRNGNFHNNNHWIFIDHCCELDRTSSVICTAIWAVDGLAELAELLNYPPQKAKELRAEADKWRSMLRRSSFDPAKGVLYSGYFRQLSWAGQIWGILAGVLSTEEGRVVLRDPDKLQGGIKPVSPYLMHYLLEAYRLCGMEDELLKTIRCYWGGMVCRGADTFWEVYQEENDFYTPYGSDPRNNSACHAWSGTPGYFLRTGEKHVAPDMCGTNRC